MKALSVPQLVKTMPVQFTPSVSRECELVRKRLSTGLTFDEATELLQLQREASLREQAAAAASEKYSESRTHNRDGRVNFHE